MSVKLSTPHLDIASDCAPPWTLSVHTNRKTNYKSLQHLNTCPLSFIFWLISGEEVKCSEVKWSVSQVKWSESLAWQAMSKWVVLSTTHLDIASDCAPPWTLSVHTNRQTNFKSLQHLNTWPRSFIFWLISGEEVKCSEVKWSVSQVKWSESLAWQWRLFLCLFIAPRSILSPLPFQILQRESPTIFGYCKNAESRSFRENILMERATGNIRLSSFF